jgi:hypothetical protein
MKRKACHSRKQSGIALVALLVLLIMAGAYALYRNTNVNTGRIQQDQKLLMRLAQAKEALIAYAVIDDKRPGRMLCPDVIGDGISPKLKRDDCEGWVSGGPDVYSGWLPWKTLDLVEPSDGYGTKFQYAVSRFFGGDRKTPLLNSDTATSLRFGVSIGTASNDIVAVIIATRGALDSRNADGDEYYFSGTSHSSDDNDVIAVITRQELMAAVEKRIANEVKTCLEGHASNVENTAHTYPWPAPLSNSIFKGVTKSLFGMIPATQPGSNPDEVLKKSTSDLKAAETSLISASTATEQLAAVQQISNLAAYARALYDRLYIAAADLEAKAKTASEQFTTLDNTINSITVSTLSTVPGAITSALPSLAAFRESLANMGLDPFLMQLQIENAALKTTIEAATVTPSYQTFNALQTQLNVFARKLLFYNVTPNPDLDSLLDTGLLSATSAVSAARTAKGQPANTALATLAITSATALYDSNVTLYNTVLSNRINIDGNEISVRGEYVAASLLAFSQNPGAETATALASVLEASRVLVASVSTASSMVVATRVASLSALDDALLAARAGNDTSLIQYTSATTISRIDALAAAMLNNGDNIAQESLEQAAATLTTATQTVPATRTAARALRTPASMVAYWVSVSQAHAADIARLARKSTWATGDSDTSAYTATRKLLASLDGDAGTISALEAYIKTPSDAVKQADAQKALADTQTQLADTLNAAGKLESLLETSLAEAVAPTVWYSSACSFLKPSTGSDTWWVANQWANLFFYQISDRVRPAIGKLTVNGSGAYPVVVISAGRALTLPPPINLQQRAIRETKHYLEGLNQDLSRELNEAKTPVLVFSNAPVSDTFNDRLAY